MKLFKRSKIGLALGAGGPKGLAHIGVIKTLLKNNVTIDCISGTSAGSLIGGLFAALNDIEKVEKLALEMNTQKLLPIISDLSLKTGLIQGKKVENFIKSVVGDIRIEDLPIKFSAVAVDLISGKTIVINKGLLYKAIRASISIPLIFSPVKYKNLILVDGGLSHPVPVQITRNMGADKVIAVSLSDYDLPHKIKRKVPSASEMINTMITIYTVRLTKFDTKDSDIVISPDTSDTVGINILKFATAKHLIIEGEKATLEKMPQIKKLNHRSIFNPG